MSKRYSGKSFKDSSVMKKPKLTFKEKRKLKEEKKKKKCAQTRPRAGTESTTRLFAPESVRVGVVGKNCACHADARGSIPRLGVPI